MALSPLFRLKQKTEEGGQIDQPQGPVQVSSGLEAGPFPQNGDTDWVMPSCTETILLLHVIKLPVQSGGNREVPRKIGRGVSVTWHLSYINPRVFQIEDLILMTTLEKVRLTHFRKEKAETCSRCCQLLFSHCV